MKLRKSKKKGRQKPYLKTSSSVIQPIECFICLFKRKTKLMHLNDCKNCKHTSNMVHQSCFRKWIKTCLNNNKKFQITCPLCNCLLEKK